jgi:hypothetical protein
VKTTPPDENTDVTLTFTSDNEETDATDSREASAESDGNPVPLAEVGGGVGVAVDDDRVSDTEPETPLLREEDAVVVVVVVVVVLGVVLEALFMESKSKAIHFVIEMDLHGNLLSVSETDVGPEESVSDGETAAARTFRRAFRSGRSGVGTIGGSVKDALRSMAKSGRVPNARFRNSAPPFVPRTSNCDILRLAPKIDTVLCKRHNSRLWDPIPL